MGLTEKTCIPCQGGIAALSPTEAMALLVQIPGWELNGNATQISNTFKFKNFKLALALTNQVAELSEQENHHPEITLGWGYCRVVFYTHKIHGLHENDFIMAAKVNQIAQVI